LEQHYWQKIFSDFELMKSIIDLYHKQKGIKMSKYNLPPIIEDWIDKLNDTNIPMHIRENYAMMLTNVKTACETELSKYSHFKNAMSVRRKR
jgi:hypothetical protein